MQGTPFGSENVTQTEDEIIVKRAVVPNSFSCSACNLKLNGYADLNAANLGDQYTRTNTFSPDEYYGLIDPDNSDAISELVSDALNNNPDIIEGYLHMQEYDNE